MIVLSLASENRTLRFLSGLIDLTPSKGSSSCDRILLDGSAP
jgi:hypothetical protein